MQKLSFGLIVTVFIFVIAICGSCSALAKDYKNINYLMKVLPSGYVSEDSQLISMDEKTTEDSLYRVMVIVQNFGIEAAHQVIRVAIFKKNGDYVGVFSGFDEVPVSVSSNGILFPFDEEFGNMIFFGKSGPIAPAFVYGQHYLLARSTSLTRQEALEQMERLEKGSVTNSKSP